jgi:hypothetical protein
VNRYGAMAQGHWKTWLSSRYAAIPDPVSFFSRMGAEVSDRIAALELDLLGPERPGEDFLTRVGRRNMARLQAEERVLRAMVLLPPEAGTSPEDGSDELPPGWAIPSAQETVAQVAAQETETA